MSEIQVVILSLIIAVFITIFILAFMYLFILICKTVFDVFTKKLV